MITLQMMKGTGPYNQMQRYIADVHKDLTPQQRAGKFTALLKKYVQEFNKQNPRENVVSGDIGGSFLWDQTADGREFWSDVSVHSVLPTVPQPKIKPEPVVAEQPKPADPALVWPKGFYICVDTGGIIRFINEEGQSVNGQFTKWFNPQSFHLFQEKYPTYKRPETPLPNGEQWKEGYTHWNPGIGNGGFQFNSKGLIHPRRGGFEIWNGRIVYEQWLADKGTITRYPDNQPLILDVPPQAPIRPVEEQRANPVGQPVQAENVAPKAPVEAPKPKKQVGWWK